MRVTQRMITNNILRALREKSGSLGELQNSLSTGKEVQKASDDPIKFARISSLKNVKRQNKQYLRNITDANSWLNTTEVALEELHTISFEAKALAQDAKRTLADDPSVNKAILIRIEGMLEDSLHIANTKFAGKNIFAGTATKEEQAFSISGSIISYNGNQEDIKRKVADNQMISLNMNGQKLMNSGLYQGLIEFRDALIDNDLERVGHISDTFDESSRKMLSLTTEVGITKKNLLLVEDRLNTNSLQIDEVISQEEDVDIAEAFVKFETEKQTYEAALQSSAKIMNLNLMKFL